MKEEKKKEKYKNTENMHTYAKNRLKKKEGKKRGETDECWQTPKEY
jgi:hypothetical protein